MNYRHAFHAGNFADVVKHATLARVIAHLKDKDAAFRLIETHAGAGLYDLTGPEASRTGEWKAGIGRLRDARLDSEVRDLLAPYLDAVAALNPAGKLKAYPGSPVLAQRWLRMQDRIVLAELEPDAAAALARHLRGDVRANVVTIDGYAALNAYVPPKERRGLVLIDPPFEERGEFERLTGALTQAHRKWPTGIYLVWYPLKDQRETLRFARSLSGIPRIVRAELSLAPPTPDGKLAGAGMIVVNPPWRLADELRLLLPALARVLGPDGRAAARIEVLAGEK